ncbi:PH domain-containing protein [Coriobacterium glomerans]|nr:PH domain-containing protein [Coriobacterium glomerans]
MTRFNGKSSWWFIAFILVWTAVMFIIMLIPSPVALWIAGAGLLMSIFLISTLIRNHVDVFDDRVEICYGPMTIRITISSIRSVERSHCLLASTANSFDRVYITVRGIDCCDDTLVSLKDNDAFIEAVRDRLRDLRAEASDVSECAHPTSNAPWL